MNKILKSTLAVTVTMLAGITVASAKDMSADDIKELSNVDGDYDLVYVHGHTAFDRYINMTDILHSFDRDNPDYNLYLKDSYNKWIYADTNKTAEVKSFDITELVGDAKYDGHVSAYKDLYTNKYDYDKTETYNFDNKRVVDKFKSETQLEEEKPTITLDTTAFATKLEETFGFKADEVYGNGIKLENGVISAVLKANDTVAEKYDNKISGKNHFFAYVLTVPTANDSTVIELNSKVLKAVCGAEETDCEKLVWDDEETKSLFVVVGLEKEDSMPTYKITVTVDGKETDLSLDLSGIKFQKESEVSEESVLFDDFEDSLYKADLDSMKADKDLWNYDYNKNKEYTATYDKDTKTFKVTGNLARMTDVKAYSNETDANYYFTFAFKLDVTKYPSLTVTTQRNGSQAKVFTAADMKEGIFTLLQNVKDDMVCENNACTTTVTVDLDGEGTEYLPTTYTIDYSEVKLGSVSKMTIEAFDDESYLSRDFDYEPKQVVNFENIGSNIFSVKEIILEHDDQTYNKAGFTSPTGYYIAYKLHVDTTENMRNNDNITIKVKNGSGEERTYTKANFDNSTDIYVLAMLNPAGVKNLDERKIVYTIDIDGDGTDYAPETYTIDWSNIKFSEVSAATLTIRDNSGLSYSNRRITGTIKETALGSGLYEYEFTVIPKINTSLNGKLNTVPEDIKVTIGETTYGIADFKGTNSLVVRIPLKPEDKNISVTVDLDGDKNVFEPYTYTVSYNNVNFEYYKKATVQEPAAEDFTKENTYGLDISKIGEMEALNTKDADGKDFVYVRGYALETSIDKSAYGIEKGYFLPISVKVENASHLTGIKLTKGALGDTKEYSKESVEAVKESGKFNSIRLLSQDGKDFKDANNFTLTFTYDDQNTYELKFDLSGVKFGYAEYYKTVYEQTLTHEVKDAVNKTTLTFGDNYDTDPVAFDDIIDYLALVNPIKHTTKDYPTYNTIVKSAAQDGDDEGLLYLDVSLKASVLNERISSIKNPFVEMGTDGKTANYLTFRVGIDKEGLIKSISGSFDNSALSATATYDYKDGDTQRSRTVQSLKADYTVELGDVVTTLSKEEAVDKQTEELEEKFYGKKENETIKYGEEGFEFSEFYTKVATLTDLDVKSVTLGDMTYGTNNVDISVGLNGHINAPVFVVVKDELYVSTLHLMAQGKAKVAVVANYANGNTTYNVETGVEDTEGTLEVGEAVVFGVADENNNVKLVDGVYVHTSNSGKNGFGFILKYTDAEGKVEEITDENTVIYRLSADGSMGMTKPETLSGKKVTYGTYLRWKNSNYDSSDKAIPGVEEVKNVTLLVPGKGIITLKFKLNMVVSE